MVLHKAGILVEGVVPPAALVIGAVVCLFVVLFLIVLFLVIFGVYHNC